MSKKQGIAPKSIKVNYIYNLAYEVFALLTPLITTPYISRVLGAEGVGMYSYTYALAQYFVLFGNLGVMTYGQMAIAGCREDRVKVSRTFYELWIIRFVAMMLSLVVYVTAAFMSTEYREARLILSVFVLAAAFDFTWLFRGLEDFSKVVIRNFIVKVFMIAMIFLFVKSKDDVNLYIFFVAMSTLLGNLTFLISMRGILCKVPLRTLNIKQHIKQTLVFFIPTIATSVYTILDKTMLGMMTEGTAQNGYYEQAHKVEQILLVIITSLNTIMRSRMSFLFQQGKLEEMKQRLNRSISFIMMIAIPMTVGLVGIAPVFIPFFLGDGFQESVVLLQIFAFLLIAIGLSNCLNTHFLGPSGRQGKNNYVLVAGAVVNFTCNYIFIPKFGAVGAACASVLAEFLILIGYLYLARDFFKAKLLFQLGWKYVVAGVIMCWAVSKIGKIETSPFLVLCLELCVGVLVYGFVILLLQDKFAKNCIHEALNRIQRGRHSL